MKSVGNLVLSLCIIYAIGMKNTYAQSATNTAQHPEKSDSKFFLGAGFGFGSLGAHSFRDQDVSENGFTHLTGSLDAGIDIGYSLSRNISLVSGIGYKRFSLSFDFQDLKYEASGFRFFIPLAVRYNLNHNALAPFAEIGCYYSNSNNLTVVEQDSRNETNLSGSLFGFTGTFGLVYHNPDSGVDYTLSLNAFVDDFGNAEDVSLAGYALKGGVSMDLF